MNTFNSHLPSQSKSRKALGGLLFLIMAAVLLTSPRNMFGQAAESANAGNAFIWVGGGASGFYTQYGARKLLGVTGYVDVDTIRRFGFEGEGRWLNFHQVANVNTQTYLAGPRFHFNVGRLQPYAKGLVGVGEFNFPYNYAHGSYLVVAPGAGVDYRFSRRIDIRLVDVEYQYWPQFTYGAMTSVGVTVGVRYRVF